MEIKATFNTSSSSCSSPSMLLRFLTYRRTKMVVHNQLEYPNSPYQYASTPFENTAKKKKKTITTTHNYNNYNTAIPSPPFPTSSQRCLDSGFALSPCCSSVRADDVFFCSSNSNFAAMIHRPGVVGCKAKTLPNMLLRACMRPFCLAKSTYCSHSFKSPCGTEHTIAVGLYLPQRSAHLELFEGTLSCEEI